MDASSISLPCQNNSFNYTFAPELFDFPIPAATTFFSTKEENMVPIFMSPYDTNSPVFDVPNCMAVPELSERETSFCDRFTGFGQKNQVFEPGDEDYCGGLMATNLCQAYDHQIAAGNWGLQGKQVAKFEASEVKVGRYSAEEKKNRIIRYLKKRNQRNFSKTIKYACRKTLADKRVRVRGRFAKKNESCEDENVMIKNTSDYSFGHNVSFYNNDPLQMICNDDDWLQAAIASLVCLPYNSRLTYI